jgi:fucose permease
MCRRQFIVSIHHTDTHPQCPQLNYTEVSTLFIGSFCGFLLAGLLNNLLLDRIGMGKTVVLGAILQACGYAIILAPPPFPVFPVTYALFIGVGLALQLSQTVTYMSGLPNAAFIMNYGQASYVSIVLVALTYTIIAEILKPRIGLRSYAITVSSASYLRSKT